MPSKFNLLAGILTLTPVSTSTVTYEYIHKIIHFFIGVEIIQLCYDAQFNKFDTLIEIPTFFADTYIHSIMTFNEFNLSEMYKTTCHQYDFAR